MTGADVREQLDELRERLERLERILVVAGWQPTPGFDVFAFQRVLLGYIMWEFLLFVPICLVVVPLVNAFQGRVSEITFLGLPLWNVQLGAEVRVLMSDGKVLVYRVTEIHPNVACPDTRAKPMSYWTTPPLALQYAPTDCREGAFWSAPTDHERLTLQTSQGYNRNWGEFIVIAEPV